VAIDHLAAQNELLVSPYTLAKLVVSKLLTKSYYTTRFKYLVSLLFSHMKVDITLPNLGPQATRDNTLHTAIQAEKEGFDSV
jgi:hypothetical protein